MTCHICSPTHDAPQHQHTVVTLWIGTASYVHATCDVFDADTLTVSALHDDSELAVWEPGQWVSATTFDPQGHPIAHYAATTPRQRVLSTKESLTRHEQERI
jgi:hypothetical protein